MALKLYLEKLGTADKLIVADNDSNEQDINESVVSIELL